MSSWFRARHRPAVEQASGPSAAVLVVPEVAGSADVVLLTRDGCHLCELAEPTVADVASRHGAGLSVVDVDADPLVREQFTDHVPVLFVRGQLVDYWQVDPDRMERALNGEPVEPPAPL